MPFIVSRVNKKVDSDSTQKIKDSYVEMLERILGKSRSFIMLDLQDECPLYVRGNDGVPAAYIEINLYGKSSSSSLEQLGKEVTDLYSTTLEIEPENIFINFRDVPDFSINGDFY